MSFKFGRPYYNLKLFGFDLTATPGFEGVAFPIIRRVFPRLLANDLVSVQPLNLPLGQLHYIDMTFTITKKSFKFGRNGYNNSNLRWD